MLSDRLYKLFQCFKALIGVQLFVAVTLMSFWAHGAPDGSTVQGWESYSLRPNILDVKAQNHGVLDDPNDNWEAMKKAHVAFVAQIFALYPQDTEIYFLARDAELLYDLARLAARGTKDFDRIHLLNVSRANMNHENIKEYLAQNGISEDAMSKGKNILLVDTGFSGTIPRTIKSNFKKEYDSQIKTQLIVSSNHQHPSSRAFLIHLNPSINNYNPGSMHGTIVNYEHMPRYTNRSSRYEIVNGRYEAMSSTVSDEDSVVSKEKALQYMEDLKAYWETSETQKYFADEKKQTLRVHDLLQSSEGISQLGRELKTLSTYESRILESRIRDIWDIYSTNLDGIKVSLDDLGLKKIENKDSGIPKKFSVIKNNPEWKSILENPDTEIPNLFKANDWQMISNLVDANIDAEINKILIAHLFDKPATGIKRALQEAMIKKKEALTHNDLAEEHFSQPKGKEMLDLIRLMAKNRTTISMAGLAVYVFPKYHNELRDLILLALQMSDPNLLSEVKTKTFVAFTPEDLKDPEYQIWIKAAKISDAMKRRAYLKKEYERKGIGQPQKAPVCQKFFGT